MDDDDAATPIHAAILGKGSDGHGDAALDGHGDAALDAMEPTAAGLSGANEPARAKKSQDQDSKRQGTKANTTRLGPSMGTVQRRVIRSLGTGKIIDDCVPDNTPDRILNRRNLSNIVIRIELTLEARTLSKCSHRRE